MYSEEYQRRSDVYLEFITEYLELEDATNNDTLKLSQLYSTFKDWWKENSSERKSPSRTDFKEDFEDKFGRMNRYGWKRMKWRVREEKENFDCDSDEDLNNDNKILNAI
jgi:hypothetical protein